MCTDDTCNDDGVCEHANHTADCDDANPCTEDDVCVDGACTGTAVVCSNGLVCDPATGGCVECLTNDDCDPGDECTGNVCVPAGPVGFAITGCPTADAVVGTVLAFGVENAFTPAGLEWYEWTVATSSNGAATATWTVDVSSTITVNHYDYADTNTNGVWDVGEDTASETADCVVTVTVATNLTVSAGSDVTYNDAAPAQGGVSNRPGGGVAPAPLNPVSGARTDLFATLSDPAYDNSELTLLWECTGAPTGMDLGDVTINQPTEVGTDISIQPNASILLTRLAASGAENTASNFVAPGVYSFRVTAANPDGATANDEVNVTITAQVGTADGQKYVADDPGGSTAGVALPNGSITHRVIAPNSIDLAFLGLFPTDGTFQLQLQDINGGANGDVVLPSTVITGAQAVQNFTVAVSSPHIDFYDLQANYLSNQGDDVFGDLTDPTAGGDSANLRIITTTSPLPASIRGDRLGTAQADVTPTRIVHSAIQAAAAVGDNLATSWSGIVYGAGDADGDGRDDLYVLRGAGVDRVVIHAGWTTADPTVTANSPWNNSKTNDGDLIDEDTRSQTLTLNLANCGFVAYDDAVSMAVADFSGDGYPDVAVGDPNADCTGAGNTLEGGVAVWNHRGALQQTFNTANGGTFYDAVSSLQFRGEDAAGSETFGYSLAAGDVAGGAEPDLIIGQPGIHTAPTGGLANSGMVHIVWGGAWTTRTCTPTAGGDQRLYNVLASATANDYFGLDVAVAEVNGSGAADTIIGIPGEDVGGAESGMVWIVNGGQGNGNITTPSTRYDGDAANLMLGRRVAGGDMTGDGKAEVIMSCHGAAVAADASGRVIIARTGTDLTGAITAFPSMTGASGTANLGTKLYVEDWNGDALMDLFMMQPGAVVAAADVTNEIRVINGNATLSTSLSHSIEITDIDLGRVGTTPPVVAGSWAVQPGVGLQLTDADAMIVMDVNYDETLDLVYTAGLAADGTGVGNDMAYAILVPED